MRYQFNLTSLLSYIVKKQMGKQETWIEFYLFNIINIDYVRILHIANDTTN